MNAIGAVDIGGTKIAVGMIDDHGRVLAQMEQPSKNLPTYAEGLRSIVGMLRETAHRAGVSIAGIGIGSTGPVDALDGRFGDLDFLPGWSGEHPVDDLSARFGVSVALENDADAAALGEAGWGAGKHKSRMIYVTVGTGIGGGVVLDGHLYRGAASAHPEFGHHVLDASGPACSCGFHGCWEALAAGPALAHWMVAQPGFRSATHGPAGDLTAKRICELARAGDPLAATAVDRLTLYLGLGLANLVNLFVPDAILLSGSLMKSSDLFLDGVRQVMQRGCRFVPLDSVEITLASLGDDANLIGAARAWHCRFAPSSPPTSPPPSEARRTPDEHAGEGAARD